MSNFSDMDNVFIMDHPLIQHKISILRNKETGDRKSTRLNSSHSAKSRMPSSA